MEKIKILGVHVDRVTMKDATNFAIERIEKGQKTFIVTPNSEILVNASKNKDLVNLINSADMVIPDGIGLVIASKILGKPLEERVTGIDLMMNLLDYGANRGRSIFFLGGKRGVADQAKEKLEERYKNIKILATQHGYYNGIHNRQGGHDEEMEIFDRINSLAPDMVFVGMGSPAQEYFIEEYRDRINSKLFMGIGGSLDVISGNVKRAPDFYQKNGLEWLYRIIKEPVRIKRSLALPVFVLKVLGQKIFGK